MDEDAAALDDLLELGDDFEAFAEQLAVDENIPVRDAAVSLAVQHAGQQSAANNAAPVASGLSSTGGRIAGLNDKVNVTSLFGSSSAVASGSVRRNASTSISKTAEPVSSSDDDNTEEYSKLRISNRLVPKLELRHALAGRRVVRVQDLETVAQQRRSASASGSWAERASSGPDLGTKRKDTLDDVYCIGVLGDKSLPKSTSGGGGKYMTWTLTDYKASVTVLLFGDAYSTHWQAELGSIFLIAQPDVLRADDQRKVSFSVKRGLQVLKLGTSPVLGRCKGRKKDGAPCSMPVDISGTGVCKFHAEKAYKEALDDRGQFRSQPLPLPVNGLLPAMNNRNVSAGTYGLKTAGYINSMAQQAGVPMAALAQGGAAGVYVNKLAAVSFRPTAPNGAVSTIDGYAMHTAEGAIGVRGETHTTAASRPAGPAAVSGSAAYLRPASAPPVASVTISSRGEVQELCASEVQVANATSATGKAAMKVKGSRRDEGTLIEAASLAESASFKNVATRVLASALTQPSHNGSAGAKHLAAMAGLKGVRDISKPATHQEMLIGMTQSIYGPASSASSGGKMGGAEGVMDAGLSAAMAKAQARRKQAYVVELPPEPGQAQSQTLKEAAYVGGRGSSQLSTSVPVSRPATVGLPMTLAMKMKTVNSTALGTALRHGQQGPFQPVKRPRDEDNLRVVSYDAIPKEAGADPLGAITARDTGVMQGSSIGALLPLLPIASSRKKAKLNGQEAYSQPSTQLLAMEEDEGKDGREEDSQHTPGHGMATGTGTCMVNLDDEDEHEGEAEAAAQSSATELTATAVGGVTSLPLPSASSVHGSRPALASSSSSSLNGSQVVRPLSTQTAQAASVPARAVGAMAPPAVPTSSSGHPGLHAAPAAKLTPVHTPRPATPASQPFHATTHRVAITNPAELDKLRASQASQVAKAKMRLLKECGVATPSPAAMLMHGTATGAGQAKATPFTAAKTSGAGKAVAAQGVGKLSGSKGVSMETAAAVLSSAHSLHEVDAEEEKVAALFKKMEGRERTEELEAQLREMTSKKVTRWMCHDCGRVYDKAPVMCTQEGHAFEKIERVEHAFKCTGCGEKIMHAQASCAKACPKCTGRAWAKTSVHKLKEWSDKPAIAGMELKTRGEEQVNSLRFG